MFPWIIRNLPFLTLVICWRSERIRGHPLTGNAFTTNHGSSIKNHSLGFVSPSTASGNNNNRVTSIGRSSSIHPTHLYFAGSRLCSMPSLSPLGSKRRLYFYDNNYRNCKSSTTLNSFLGSEGILGVGAPEIAVTLLVGYFILGPQDLYKLVKEVGKAFNTFRVATTEATKQFEDTMESTIQMDEFKQAQRELSELNDAFSFRRSINTDVSEPFAEKTLENVDPSSGMVVPENSDNETPSLDDTPKKKKKKKRRRLKKKVPVQEEPEMTTESTVPTTPTPIENNSDYNMDVNFNGNEMVPDIPPDLDMMTSDAFQSPEEQAAWEAEMDEIQKTRKERLEESGAADWFTPSCDDEPVDEEILSQNELEPTSEMDPLIASGEKSRFASQLAGDWNEQILANEDKLSPLAKVMERLAILEEENSAANLRLEEEFRLRGDLEEKFYKDKRKILEEAAVEVQTNAYVDMNSKENVIEENSEEQKTI